MKFNSFLLLFFLGMSNILFAADRYWVGNNSNKNWNATANWSATSGGAGGASVPVAADDVYFNSGGAGQLILDMSISVKMITMDSGFGDTIKQNGKTITVGIGGMILNSGTFQGNTGNITVSGSFTLAGAAFASTSDNLTIAGNYTKSAGTFFHNNGVVLFTVTSSLTGSTDFYDLIFNCSASLSTYTISSSSTFNATHSLVKNGGGLVRLNDGVINVQGDLWQNNIAASGGGTATVNINGSGDQILNGSTGTNSLNRDGFPNVTINKSGGVLYLKNTVNVRGTWDYIAGVVNDTTYDAELSFNSGGTNTVKGTQKFNRLWIGTSGGANNFTVFAGDTLTVNTIYTGVNAAIIYTGVINVTGDFWLGSSSPVGAVREP